MPVKAPVAALPAAPPVVSLISSAEIVNESEARWEAGFSFEPETCGTGVIGSVDPCSSDTKAVAGSDGSVDVEPIGLFAGDSCSSFGFGSRDWQARARRKLIACESNLIEDELWNGTLARANGWDNKFLASLDSDVVTDGAETPLRALACLEQALAECNCGGQGMIHAMPQVVTHWVNLNLVRRHTSTIEGRGQVSRLETELGTIVVPGSGYDGSGPPGVVDGAPTPAADGSIWAYATSRVHIRLGPIMVVPSDHTDALNRSTNLITYRAERLAATTWDCCHVAAEINLDLCGIGGPGS